MTDRESKEGKERFGPIIERNERRTKRHSKRVLVFFVLLLSAVILLVTSRAKRPDEDSADGLSKQLRAPRDGFENLIREMQRSARRAPHEVEAPPSPEPREEREAPAPLLLRPRNRKKYYSDPRDRQAAERMREIKMAALTAIPRVEGFPLAEERGGAGKMESGGRSGESLSAAELAAMAAGLRQPDPDPNHQVQKGDFLRGEKGGASMTAQGYSEFLPEPQKFYWELKAGTVIPGILVNGIDSDLPGQIVGQVAENVWDTARGKNVLIPKGTRILGVYDSQVTFGQRRVLVVWNRLVFPDGTTLNIAGSPGVDQAGYAGLSGRVDEHWGRLVGTALLSSLFVAGAELVHDDKGSGTGNGTERKSPGDIASEQAAKAILDMAAKLTQKVSDIQPTIRIRPGKRFNIFVRKDIVFPEPYM
ncbi:TrbI/VirB10 family protein [uncultured Fretibacterium sp.]|uniref:TrbI/VirB10 family protein n=1 Tax=uncultured Fretibacterium sp. TaxID=1678694 RepID=UPI00325FC784